MKASRHSALCAGLRREQSKTTQTQPAAPSLDTLDQFVVLRCHVSGCPRSMKLPFDAESMPPGTVEIRQFCPWHMTCGESVMEECYDEGGRLLDPGAQHNAGGQRTAVAGTLDRPCSTGDQA